MLFRSALVIISFLFIYAITWQTEIITDQILLLMGISGATALGAVIVDVNKSEEEQKNIAQTKADFEQLLRDHDSLKTAIADFGPRANLNQGALDSLALKEKQLGENEAHLDRLSTASRGFLRDVLTDVNGYSFHRFQIFVWTIVLGIIFLIEVYSRLSMPKFSTTLLALMGISGATYVGFKIPEQQQPPSQPNQ